MHTDCKRVTLCQQARKREKESAGKITVTLHLSLTGVTRLQFIRPTAQEPSMHVTVFPCQFYVTESLYENVAPSNEETSF